MPINIINKCDCTGCGACWNVCPKDCIVSFSDKEGFLYPKVDEEKCIDCGLCLKVCPIQNKIESSGRQADVYAAWSKDVDVRYQSTSGGAFSELAYSFLDMGGVVVGAAYDHNNLVRHVIVSSIQGVDKIRQSKYIQSNIGDIYRSIKDKLEDGTKVLFCGAPCQVAGLKHYLQKEYDLLYTVDFICRGVNSPKAYSYWLKELETIFGSRVNKVWFKYKENGWKKSPLCTRVDFENGKSFTANGEKNLFMMGYLRGNLYLRPSCGECHFKGQERYSDITLADFWKIDSQYDDDGGTSMVMINSEKGHMIFDLAKERLITYKKDFEEIKSGNYCFDKSVKLNPRGEEFLSRLDEKPFSKLLAEYMRVPFYKVVLRKVKKLVRKVFLRDNSIN